MRILGGTILLCLLVACRGGGSPAGSLQTPDTTFLAPVDTLGLESGDTNYVFSSIWDASADASGRILVLDTQDCSIRAYSSGGIYLGRAGGRGSGPGELQFPMGMACLSGGGIAAVDPLSASVVFYDSTLSHTRTLSGFFPSPPMRISGADSDRIVGLMPGIVQENGSPMVRTVLGRWRDSAEPDLIFFQSTSPMPGGEGVRLQGPEYLVAGCDDGRVALSPVSPDEYRIDCFDGSGAAGFTISEEWEPVPKTEEELSRGVDAVAISVVNGSASARTSRVEDTEPFHDAVADIFFGPGGDLWVRLGSESVPTFRVYDRSGAWTRTVRIPALDSSDGPYWSVSVGPGGVLAWQMDPEEWPMVVVLGPRGR